MSDNITTSKISVVLKGYENWFRWIELIKSASIKWNIWIFVNPDLEKTNIPTLLKPVRLTYKDVYPGKSTKFKDLTLQEVKLYNKKVNKYADKKKQFRAC